MMLSPSFLYRLGADALVILHLLFILFVIGGGLLLFRHRRWALIHLPAAVWAATVEFTGWHCPLTPLENWLRRQAGGSGSSSGFVEHYLLPLIYPETLTRELQFLLGALVVAINLVLYFLAFRRKPPRAQGKGAAPAPGSSGPGTP